ncbi:bifunctional metallophosphatase/5'-nucleotidase [Actinocorallia sp. API 0066]|uniref:bifunctional metallophosphatase/5'-nucleotidase n=1 Tax=Actinocorallia sp. API 0066 TaxID=2896846 RepID=UPI001E466143|nr:bifunctional metallophosphatase/5'-nucleotidase [Actinocorallia sp. API 0066]MCD0450367.1 bifunctional metallophosphatase/5'-nucleotidase [Actinocorallia sp. API 0066]
MMPSSLARALVAGAVAAAVLAAGSGVQAKPKPPKPPKPEPSVPVRLLALNDFHGNLEPPTGSSGRMVDEHGATVDAGGAAYVAAWMKRMTNKDTIKVAQGDLIGATPLISAAYHDEPSVEFLGDIGVTVSSVGNHEFDEGYAELKRIMKGGSHPVDGPSPAGRWKGAKYDYIGANVLLEKGRDLPKLPGMEVLKKIKKKRLDALIRQYGLPALPPIAVRKVNGQQVGFIGAVTETTPTIVTASGIAGLKFAPVVRSAEFGSKLLKELGVEAQVLLVHEGDNVLTGQSPDACSTTTDPDGSAGAGTEIATRVDPEIDLILSGHSHQAYVCTVKDPAGNDRLYSQGGSFGRVISQVDLKVFKKSGEIDRTSVKIDNQIVTRDIPADAKTERFVQTWKDRVAAVANQPVGSLSADLTRTQTPSGESTLGNLIADAQLAATAAEGGAQIALMNPGGIRADLPYAPDGVVTYGEAFAVQPFNNLMQVVTLTGAQLDALLEQQWTPTRTAVLLPSASLTYTATLTNPFGDRVSALKINGTPVDPAASYRVAANNFLVGGGDAFSTFTQATNLWSGPLDLDAFTNYLKTNSPVSPPPTTRITLN